MTSGAAPVSSPNLPSMVPATGAAGAPQAGQMIRAVVMAQLQDGLMTLSTASGRIVARSDRPLPKGAPVEVTVSEDPGAPGLIFTVRTTKPAATSAAPALEGQGAQRAQAVTVASQASVQRQVGLGPLLADLGQAETANVLPKAVREAAAPVLARALPSNRAPDAAQIKQAAAASGLFLEASLAAVAKPPAGDLKAALLVLVQVLRTWQAATQPAAGASSPPPPPAMTGPVEPDYFAAPSTASGHVPAPPRAATPAALQALAAEFAADLPPAPDPASRQPASPPVPAASPPAPPYRGGPILSQPAGPATLMPDAPPADVARHLGQQAAGALARQTLMQAASLPESIGGSSPPRLGDPSPGDAPAQPGARWNFEIPFATPQGSAVAQFEIHRDSPGTSGGGAASTEPVWRTRFSIEVEPLGPVHVQLALLGAQAHVALWAERPEGLERLRGQGDQLSRALAAADCLAEVSFHSGAPLQPRAAAGRFIDMAS